MVSYSGPYRKLPFLCSAFIAYFLIGTLDVDFQVPVNSRSPAANAKEIVDKAFAESANYVSEFRNLVSREKKTFKIFDKKGNLKRERTIVSNFLVYDLTNSKRSMTEFRSVLSVDGKTIADSDKRAIDLFERVSNSAASANELERIQKESLRFDEELRIYGLTLYQAIVLSDKVRDIFSFEVTGTERLGDAMAYVVRYRQTKQSPFVRVGEIRYDIPAILDYHMHLDGLEKINERLSGTLWIDTKSFQIVREERKLTISPPEFSGPAIVAANEFEYSPSVYGIRTPKYVKHTEYRIDKRSARTLKHVEITFEYSDFTRPDVEVNAEKPTN